MGERLALGFHLFHLAHKARCHSRRGEFDPGYTCRFNELLLLGRESLELLRDHLAQAFWHLDGDIDGLIPQRPASVMLDQQPLRYQMGHDVDDEERITIGPLEEVLDQRLGKYATGKAHLQIFGDRFFAERRQRELAALTMQL